MDTILRIILRILRPVYYLLYYFPLANSFHLPFSKIVRAFFMGFTPDEYVLYQLDRNDRREYISDFERMMFALRISNRRMLLDNKAVFYSIIRNYAPVSEQFGCKSRGRYSGHPDPAALLEEKGRLVFKRIADGSGKGFRLLEFDGGVYRINRRISSRQEIERLLADSDDYIIEDVCVQSAFENTIFPHCVNTLRLITAEQGSGHILLEASHRFGADENACIDNGCAGGLCCKIDMNSGILSSAHWQADGKLLDNQGRMIEYDCHPITRHPLKGVQIPDWPQIVSFTLDLHKKVSFIGADFIAWDIALTDNGPQIIEANATCGMQIQNMGGMRHGPVGQWLRERKYIR